MIIRYIKLLRNGDCYTNCLCTSSIIINLLILRAGERWVKGGNVSRTIFWCQICSIFLTQYPDVKFAQGCSRVLQQQFGWKPRRQRPMPMSFIFLPFLVIIVFLIIVILVIILVILVTFVCIFKWSRTKCPFLQAGPYFWHGGLTNILIFVKAVAGCVKIFSKV